MAKSFNIMAVSGWILAGLWFIFIYTGLIYKLHHFAPCVAGNTFQVLCQSEVKN